MSYKKPSDEEIASGYREFVGADQRENESIDIWHFAMMNDVVRNSAYEAALKRALEKGGTVLDIGTGSGLLSMLAVRHGASQVVTCEAITVMANKAKEIIRHNGLADRIRVINKRSTDLQVGAGKDIAERADVLVTEIFDDGLLGEGAFVAIDHARKHLLKPGAQVIPAGVRVMAVCIESQEIHNNDRVGAVSGFDLSPFNELSGLSGKQYVGYHLDKMNHRRLSRVQDIFEFDFSNLPGNESVSFDFEIVESGTCHAMSFWYELKMDEHATISTAPGLPSLSSWKQAVQLFDEPKKLVKGERYRITAHHNSEALWFTA
jgi:hypothetical protein